MSIDWGYGSWILAAVFAALGTMACAHFIEAHYRKCARIFSRDHLKHSEPSHMRRFWKWFCYASALTCLCLAIADPRYGLELQKVSRSGRDIVFVLDVSKSMLASDITPNRLKRAKADIIDGLQDLSGHRIGLIVFAGDAKEICPLTYDHSHFIQRLRDVSPDSIPRGGTNIGDALRLALDLVEAGANLGHQRDLILITDGQDLTGYFEEVAKRAATKKVSIYTLGIGSATPTSIRLADGTYLESEGKVVETALNPEPLQLISQFSLDGFYQNLSTTPTWLQNITKVIESKEFTRRKESQQQRKTPRYAPLLLLTMIFWGLSVTIPDRVRKKTISASETDTSSKEKSLA